MVKVKTILKILIIINTFFFGLGIGSQLNYYWIWNAIALFFCISGLIFEGGEEH